MSIDPHNGGFKWSFVAFGGDKRHPQINGDGDAPIMPMRNGRPVIPPRPAELSTNQQNDGRLA